MFQQVYMPDGRLIFQTEDEKMFYPASVAEQMWNGGYECYLDSVPFPDAARKGRWLKAAEPAEEEKEKLPVKTEAAEEKPKKTKRKKPDNPEQELDGQISLFG